MIAYIPLKTGDIPMSIFNGLKTSLLGTALTFSAMAASAQNPQIAAQMARFDSAAKAGPSYMNNQMRVSGQLLNFSPITGQEVQIDTTGLSKIEDMLDMKSTGFSGYTTPKGDTVSVLHFESVDSLYHQNDQFAGTQKVNQTLGLVKRKGATHSGLDINDLSVMEMTIENQVAVSFARNNRTSLDMKGFRGSAVIRPKDGTNRFYNESMTNAGRILEMRDNAIGAKEHYQNILNKQTWQNVPPELGSGNIDLPLFRRKPR